ncbi:MAG: hypothetical protein UY18_C0018G0003 [Microgenomates group bacterium GW2011_GWF2_47_9]|nr:MAG: hypothetical protein UY18_C0018G0003 [Microgenomates group bacterium GW2011_GWF2_47_9]
MAAKVELTPEERAGFDAFINGTVPETTSPSASEATIPDPSEAASTTAEPVKSEAASTTAVSKDDLADEKPVPKAEFKKRLGEVEQKRLDAEKRAIEAENRYIALQQQAKEAPKPKEEEEVGLNLDEELAILDAAEVSPSVKEALLKIAEKTARATMKPITADLEHDKAMKKVNAENEYRQQIVKDFPEAMTAGSELNKLATDIYNSNPIYASSISGLREAIERANDKLAAARAAKEAATARTAAEEAALRRLGHVESPSGGGSGGIAGGGKKDEEQALADAVLGKGALIIK